METKTDVSYGVVPVHRTSAGLWQVLLINQRSVRGDVYWTLPKGHAEVGETPEAAALRELKEETGVSAVFEPDLSFEQQYSFVHDGVKIEKTVIYYLGLVTETTATAQPEEVVELKWCSFGEAIEQVSYPALRVVLESAEAKLV